MTCFPFLQLLFDLFSKVTRKLVFQLHLRIPGEFDAISSVNDKSGKYFLEIFPDDIVEEKDIIIVFQGRQFCKPGQVSGGYIKQGIAVDARLVGCFYINNKVECIILKEYIRLVILSQDHRLKEG